MKSNTIYTLFKIIPDKIERKITVFRRQLFSRRAPKQPKKPKANIIHPDAQNNMDGSNTISNASRICLFFSVRIHIPRPAMPIPQS